MMQGVEYNIGLNAFFNEKGGQHVKNVIQSLRKEAQFLAKEFVTLEHILNNTSSFKNYSKAIETINKELEKVAGVGKDFQATKEDLAQFSAAVANAKAIFQSLTKELKGNEFKAFDNQLRNLINSYDKLKFSIEKNIELKKRWTSASNIESAKSLTKAIEQQEKEIQKLFSLYEKLTIAKREALASGDISKVSSINSELSRVGNAIKEQVNVLDSFKQKTRDTIENLSKLNRFSWLKEVGKRALSYTGIYAGIFGVFQVVKNGIQYINQYNLGVQNIRAVLKTTNVEAIQLEETFISLSKTFGGTLEDINKVALELGRAGVATKDLADSTKIVIQMAMLTGDSFEIATNALVSFKENFEEQVKNAYEGQNALEILGNKLAYIANASRMTTQDIGTFANYALATAKSVGLTIDMVGALAIAFNNAGNNASTVGTMIRRLGNLLMSGQKDVVNFFDSIGINQQVLLERLRQGGDTAKSAFNDLVTTLGKLNGNEVAELTKNMDILAKQTLLAMINNAQKITEEFRKMGDVTSGELENAAVIAEAYLKVWERFKNLLGEVATIIGDDIVGGISKALSLVLNLFEDENTKKLTELSSKFKDLQEKYKLSIQIGDVDGAKKYKEQIEDLKKEIVGYQKVVEKAKTSVLTLDAVFKLYSEQLPLSRRERRGRGLDLAGYIDRLKSTMSDGKFKESVELLNKIYSLYGDDENVQKFIIAIKKAIAGNTKLYNTYKGLIPGLETFKQKVKEAHKEIKNFSEEQKKHIIKFVSDADIKNLRKLLSIAQTSSDKLFIKNTINKYVKEQLDGMLKYLEKQKQYIGKYYDDLSKVIATKNPFKIATFVGQQLQNENLPEEYRAILVKVQQQAEKLIDLKKLDANVTNKATKAQNQYNSEIEKYKTLAQSTFGKFDSIKSSLLSKLDQGEESFFIKINKQLSQIQWEKLKPKDLDKAQKELEVINKLLVEYYEQQEKLKKEKLHLFDVDSLKEESKLLDKIAGSFYGDIKESIEKAQYLLKENIFIENLKKQEEQWKKDGITYEQIQKRKALLLKQFQLENLKVTDKISYMWIKTTKDIYNAFEDNFFNLLMFKFKSFKDFLKSLFSDILNSVITPFARMMAQGISSALTTKIGLPRLTMAGFTSGVPTIAQQLGLSYSNGKYIGTVGGKPVAISADGKILQGQDVISAATPGKSFISSPSSYIMKPFSQTGQWLVGHGYNSAGFATIGFGHGLAHPFTPAINLGTSAGYYGQIAGAGASGALIGYGAGWLGDKILGKNTKAGMFGAIGGGVGSSLVAAGLVSNPVGWLILAGSTLLGGALGGKWEKNDYGLGITSPLSFADTSGLKEWEFWRKDKWFGGDNKKDKLKDLDQYMKTQIQNLLFTMENIVDYINGTYDQIDIILQQGKFSSKDKYFEEYLSKKVLANILGIDKTVEKVAIAFEEGGYRYEGGWSAEGLLLIEKFYKGRLSKIDDMIKKGLIDETDKAKFEKLNEVYQSWKKYAKNIDKSVTEAIQDAFKDVVALDKEVKAFVYKKQGLNGSDIISSEMTIQTLSGAFKQTKQYFKEAGLSVAQIGQITEENFVEMYKTILKNNPTPEVIERMNALGKAILSVAENAQIVTEALNKYNKNFNVPKYNTVLSETTKKYFGESITNPEVILNKLSQIEDNKTYKIGKNEYSGEQIKSAFAPYINILVADATLIHQGSQDYLDWLLKFRKNMTDDLFEILQIDKQQIEVAKFYKDQAEKDLQRARDLVGIQDLTLDNFYTYYKKAMEANPSVEDIAKWELAKEKVKEAAQANAEYASVLDEVTKVAAKIKEDYWKSVQKEEDSFDKLVEQVKLYNEKKSEAEKKAADNSLKLLNEKYQEELELINKQLSYLNGASSVLENLINSLDVQVSDSTQLEAKFYKYLNQAEQAFGAKNYEEYQKYLEKASKYISFLDKKQYSSEWQQKYEKAVVLNKLKDLKSPTDLMIDHLKQIADNTQELIDKNNDIINATQDTATNTSITQESIWELINIKIGGKNFTEVVKDGVIQGLKSKVLTTTLGGSLEDVIIQLKNSNAYWKKVPLANGKIGVLVDFDEDGKNDLTLSFDASGKLIDIDTNTANLYTTMEKVFGDKTISEVLKSGVIQAIYNGDTSISLGDTLSTISSALEAMSASSFIIGDGTILVDIDQNGTWDFKLVQDDTGHLKEISDNTKDISIILADRLKKSVQTLYESGGNISKSAVENYNPTPEYASTIEGQLTGTYYVKLLEYVSEYVPEQTEEYVKQHKQEILDLGKKISDTAKYIIEHDPEGGQDLSKLTSGLYNTKYETLGGAVNLYDDLKKYLEELGYATGGYTGDIPTYSIAGFVHGQEFVVNAPTTKKLGLNKDNGSVFEQMLKEMNTMNEVLYVISKELYDVKQENIKMRRSLQEIEEK